MESILVILPSGTLSHLLYIVILYIILRLTRPVYLAIKKRGAGYGIVFDSVSGKPVALATVRLIDLHNLPVSSAVTDKQGRYRLAASKGEYYVDVVKSGYQFPSKNFKKNCAAYDNTLPTHHIKIKDHGMITKNIPVDPLSHAIDITALLPRICLSTNLQFLIAYLSPLVVIAYPWMTGSMTAWIIYIIYVLVTIGRIANFKAPPKAFGVIRDASTRQPLENVVVRIFDAKFNKLKETQVTSPRGRYAFVINPGEYYVFIEHEGYKKVRINYPHIRKEGFVLSKDVSLKRLPEQAKPDETVTELPSQPTSAQMTGQFMQ